MVVGDGDLLGWVWLGVGTDLALCCIAGLKAVMTFLLVTVLRIRAIGLGMTGAMGLVTVVMMEAMGLIMPVAVRLVTLVTLVASHCTGWVWWWTACYWCLLDGQWSLVWSGTCWYSRHTLI